MTTWKYQETKKRTGEVITADKRIYMHILHNDEKATDDKVAFKALLDILEEELLSGKQNPAQERLYNKYYDIHQTPIRGITLHPKQDAIDKVKKNYG